MIVVDASVVLDLILAQSVAETIGQRLFAPTETLHAPELLDLEVLQVLRRHWRAGSLSASRGKIAVADLHDLPVVRHPHGDLIERIWQLRASVTAYDAVYLALAEALDAPLLTQDARLARAPGHTARVELMMYG